LSPTALVALAAFSGLAFACIGLAYRAAHAREVSAMHVALAICIPGVVFFGLAARGSSPSAVPAVVWVLAVAAGAGQYVTLRMVGPALRRGPLSAMWCAVNLNFAMAIGYARLFLGERISTLGYAGALAAAACVLTASLGQQSPEEARPRPAGAQLSYGAILLTILLANGLWMTGIKHLSAQALPDGRSDMTAFGNWFAMGVYLLLGLLILGDLLLARRAVPPAAPWLATGAFAAVGSVAGMWALGVCSPLPAAVVFTLNSVVSLLTTALVAAIAFREQRTPSWYGTVALAVVAVVLVNAPTAMR
jgi:drug/metabolite transporter (DMT)-like permease